MLEGSEGSSDGEMESDDDLGSDVEADGRGDADSEDGAFDGDSDEVESSGEEDEAERRQDSGARPGVPGGAPPSAERAETFWSCKVDGSSVCAATRRPKL